MVDKKPGVLILSPFFSPNIGGVESHLDDLVSALDKRNTKFLCKHIPLLLQVMLSGSQEKKKEVA